MGPALQTDGREMLLAQMRGDRYEPEWPPPLYEVAPAVPTSVTRQKGWGAAAQMVKWIAEARGWPHDGHHQLWRAVNRLVEETGDRDIRTAFGLAGTLHTNFYEGWLPRETVEDHLDQVADLLSKLETLPS